MDKPGRKKFHTDKPAPGKADGPATEPAAPTRRRPSDTGKWLRIQIPERAKVILVGRTIDACEKLTGFLKPRVEAKGGSLKVYSQLHELEEMAGERVDVLVLDASLGPTARETVTWVAKRSNARLEVYDFGA